ncbi:MAG: bacterial Ig-like domain-containing protein [Clostridia bacterium]|nr:bacterial Ig-like domain-containing protein [Clostridia bacterium]
MKKLAIISAVLLIVSLLSPLCAADGKTVAYHTELDFADISDTGSFTGYTGFGDDWKAVQATNYETRGDGGTLRFAPFAELVLQHRLTGPYVFETDVKSPGSQFFGVFVRSTGENLSGVTFFEHDGILTESGDADNEGIGATGIYVMPRGDRIILCIKTADTSQAKGIGTDKTYFDTGADMSGGFARLTFEDDGAEVRILVDGNLVCTVKMSDPSDTDFMSTCRLFTRAEIFDANGTGVKTVAGCRISADFSTVAFGMRISEAFIDNVSLTEYEKEPEETKAPLGIRRVDIKCQPEKSEYLIGEELDLSDTFLEVTYENGVKEDVRVTADMVFGFDSSVAGPQVLTVKYGGTSAAYSVYVVKEHGQSVTDEQTTLDFDTAAETKPEEEEDNGGIGKGVIIAVIAVAAVFCVMMIVMFAGRKKDRDNGGKGDMQ